MKKKIEFFENRKKKSEILKNEKKSKILKISKFFDFLSLYKKLVIFEKI